MAIFTYDPFARLGISRDADAGHHRIQHTDRPLRLHREKKKKSYNDSVPCFWIPRDCRLPGLQHPWGEKTSLSLRKDFPPARATWDLGDGKRFSGKCFRRRACVIGCFALLF